MFFFAKETKNFMSEVVSSMSGSKRFEKVRGGKILKFQKFENAMSAEREHVELLARGSPQVTSLS